MQTNIDEYVQEHVSPQTQIIYQPQNVLSGKSLHESILSIKDDIIAFGLDTIGAERFLRIAINDLSQNEKLARCNPLSIIGSLMIAAQLGLEPNTPLGECYLIPYDGFAQFNMGYQGRIKLLMQSEEVLLIDCTKVYSNDTITIDRNATPPIHHIVGGIFEPRTVVGYYAEIRLKNGYTKIATMSVDEMKTIIAGNLKRFKSTAWKTDFDAMAMKYLIGQVIDYMPFATKRYAKLDNTIKFYDPNNKPTELVDMTELPDHYYEIEKKVTA
jgi:recombination protein RecT